MQQLPPVSKYGNYIPALNSAPGLWTAPQQNRREGFHQLVCLPSAFNESFTTARDQQTSKQVTNGIDGYVVIKEHI